MNHRILCSHSCISMQSMHEWICSWLTGYAGRWYIGSVAKRDRAQYMRDYRARKQQEKTDSDSFAVPMPPADPAVAIAEWGAETFTVPDGILAGQPFVLDEWQIDFLRDALREGIREAGLSVARKNGKSALIALLFLAFLRGPLHRPGWRGVVASITGELAKELRHQIEAINSTAEESMIDIRLSPTPGRILGPNRTRLDFLAADKSTGHAIGADLVVIDEAGLLEENKRELWSALYSCISGRNGRVICISIQADGPMFGEMRDRANAIEALPPATSAPRRVTTVWHEYTPADTKCRVDDEAAWHQANPGLNTGIKSLEYMQDMAQKALITPTDQAFFRAHDLNLPQAPARETICNPDEWEEIETETPPSWTNFRLNLCQ